MMAGTRAQLRSAIFGSAFLSRPTRVRLTSGTGIFVSLTSVSGIFVALTLVRGTLVALTLVIVTFVALTLVSGCGIYTVEEALNPPFGISISSIDLKFSGANGSVLIPPNISEDKIFKGYTLWFKELPEDPYKVIGYKGGMPFPTIPRFEEMPPDWVQVDNSHLLDPNNPRREYIVLIDDMEHPDSNKSFFDLNQSDPSKTFYFAVSATGVDGQQSEKVEFGRWPPAP